MSKYIIDVGDAYTKHICGKGDMLCLPVRINEFEDNWMNTNIPLTPYTEPDTNEAYQRGYEEGYAVGEAKKNSVEDEAYQRGLNDAWAAARKIAVSVPLGGMSQLAIKRMFGVEWQYVLINCTPAKVIEKLRQHEQEKEEIHVGDEVSAPFGKAVVTRIANDKIWFCYKDGHSGFEYKKDAPRKTGRHFPEIAEVLRKIKEE